MIHAMREANSAQRGMGCILLAKLLRFLLSLLFVISCFSRVAL